MTIDGCPERQCLTFGGSVIGPTFHFDRPKLKFGTASYGFPSTQYATLTNTALVPMTYTLRVPRDGTGAESVSSTSDYDSTLSLNGSSSPTGPPPREFEITPASGTIPAQSDVKIKVDLCSNTIKKYDLDLVVDIEGVGEAIVSLPITAR